MAVESENQVERNTDPGVRIVGGRIYESSNGKSCHQCRQKTTDFAAFCKAMKKDKPCPIKYCHKCLLNRYGEKAEEVASLVEWTCPKCRGICNCSLCMKKRGHQPTGKLVHRAKATGFSSVSELLQVKGPRNFSYLRSENPENLVTSPRNPGRESSLEGKGDLLNEEPHVNVPEKANREGLKDTVEESSPKKIEISEHVPENDAPEKVSEEGADKEVGKGAEDKNLELKKCDAGHKNVDRSFGPRLPEGISSISIYGIDLPPEYAGHVLQFLEFCSAFGKVLDLRKGQAECVVRELLNGQGDRRQQFFSMLIQMIIQLLSVLLEDRREMSLSFGPADETWFKALGERVSQSNLLDDFPSELFENGIAAFEDLDTSKKLELLNFLCDEALCTTVMRDWIDKQNLDYDERKREAREKVAAAKEKEKQLKQKLRDEVATTAVMAGPGAPLSISEHEAVVSQIRARVKEAHAETVDAMGMCPKKRKRSDAVRTDPFMLDENGRVFWRLTSYTEEPKLLLQDVGSWGEVCPHEKWVAFMSEQRPEIEDYLSYLRVKQRRRAQKYADAAASAAVRGTETEANPQVS